MPGKFRFSARILACREQSSDKRQRLLSVSMIRGGREREEKREGEGALSSLDGDRATAQLSNKRGDLGFVTGGRQIRYVEEGSLARTFESRRILNCLPRNVALPGSPSRYWQPVNTLCGILRRRRGRDRSWPRFRFPREIGVYL